MVQWRGQWKRGWVTFWSKLSFAFQHFCRVVKSLRAKSRSACTWTFWMINDYLEQYPYTLLSRTPYSRNSKMESDLSEDLSNSPAPKRQQGRERLRRVEQWARKKRKIMKDAGKAYKTYKGEPRSSKTLKTSLCCRCRNHCASRVSLAERKHIFDEF